MGKLSAIGLSVVLAVAFIPTTASAKPTNAATVVQNEDAPGVNCLVSDDFINYAVDPTCQWQIVRRNDRGGTRVMFQYRDHGQLQPGQTAPATALRNSFSFPGTGANTGLMCRGTETVTPSGEYRSDMHCN